MKSQRRLWKKKRSAVAVESLRRQLRQTEMERDILKKLSPFSVPAGNAHDLRLIDQFIKQEEPHFAVRLLCNTLEVSKTGPPER